MNFNISKIVSEWEYRVKDGCPDSNNRQHLRVLSEVLCDFGCTNSETNSIISNLQNPNGCIEDFQKFCVEVGKIISKEELITEASISLAAAIFSTILL